jgi:hypothetical protein
MEKLGEDLTEIDASPGRVIIETTKNNPFWSIVAYELGMDLPPYLKHLCAFLGLDSAAAFRHFDQTSFTELEEFARTDMLGLLSHSELTDQFYGIYYKKPQNFRILPGHKNVLLEMKHICQDASKFSKHFNKLEMKRALSIHASSGQSSLKANRVESRFKGHSPNLHNNNSGSQDSGDKENNELVGSGQHSG